MNDKIVLLPFSEAEFKTLIKSSFEEILEENKSIQRNKELLSFKEVISLLGISASTLNAWKREGKIPYHKLNGRIFFKYDEIVQSLKSAGNTKARHLQAGLLDRRMYV
jgi:hypothetical protein